MIRRYDREQKEGLYMRIGTTVWCVALLLSLLLPVAAGAQQTAEAPLLGQPNPPIFTLPNDTPSPETIAKRDSTEVPSITNVAKGIYVKLLGGSLGGYRLTPDLNLAWTPALEATASQQLAARGTPSWSFVGNGLTSAGSVSVYRLAYPQAGPVYMSVGVADNGVVYDLRLAGSPQAAAPPP
jgi:hypothetical protein